ncbi:MAG: CRISPR-associated protein Csx15 [Candidatus Cryosericum sp.]
MTIINFAHPLTDDQRKDVEREIGSPVDRVIMVDSQIDTTAPLVPQVSAWLDGLPLQPEEWQSEPLLVILPSLSYSVAVLLAELHGRTGYFPAIIRLRPAQNAVVPRFDVGEIINLQTVREDARIARFRR